MRGLNFAFGLSFNQKISHPINALLSCNANFVYLAVCAKHPLYLLDVKAFHREDTGARDANDVFM